MAPFSYAQAAKGQVAAKSQNASASSPSSGKEVDDIGSPLTSTQSKVNWADESTETLTMDENRGNGEQSEGPSRKHSNAAHQKILEEQLSSPEQRGSSASTTGKDDDASSMPTSASESAWENKSQSSTPADAAVGPTESTGRSGKGKKEQKEKAPAPKPVPLKEAPIPTVNIWAQRAQDIKAKQTSLPSPQTIGRKGIDASPVSPTSSKDMNQQGKKDEATKPAGFRGQDRASSDKTSNSNGPEERSRSTRGQAGAAQITLPMVQDQNSWPTPESAQDEERRKPQERERPTQGITKPHSKSEWVNMPYTPTVKFETPLPPTTKRGGRISGRGGRELGVRGGSTSAGSNPRPYSNGSPTSEIQGDNFNNRPRSESGIARQASLPSSKPKNASTREHAFSSTGFSPEDNDQNEASTLTSGEPNVARDMSSGNATSSSDAANVPESHKLATQPLPPADGSLFIPPYRHKSNPTKATESQSANTEQEEGLAMDNGFPSNKMQWSERKERSGRPYEGFKDAANASMPRERGEGRPDRGRGGRGGKGGNNHFNAHNQVAPQINGQLPASLPSPHAVKNGAPFNTQYHGQPNQYMGTARGGYRSGPRAASIPADAAYARYPGSYVGGVMPPYMGTAMYDPTSIYSSMGPMNPYGEQYLIAETISTQLSYYFSLDNLLKDTFLRSHMDSQGFVALSLLANFSRMKSLTTDVELIKFVCSNSPELELRSGLDGKERIRKREGWEQWVLGMSERDQAARNDGPPAVEQPPAPSRHSFEPYAPRMPGGQNEMHFGEGSYAGYQAVSTPFSPVSVATTGGYTQNPSQVRHSMSAADSEVFRHGQSTHTSRNAPRDAQTEGDSFPDGQIELLTVVVRQQGDSQEHPPFHSEATRTFSHGSIDATTSIAELTNGNGEEAGPQVNGSLNEIGDGTPFDRKKSPSSRSAVKANTESPVGLFWIKEKETPEPLPSGSTYELYTHLHMKALQQRENAEPGVCPYDMDVLYQFWSHFLIRNYNGKMYNEFRQFAHEDATEHSSGTGMVNLIKYYSEALSSQHLIRDRVARHYIELVNDEDPGKDRPAFKQLRAAWRNGALNIKNRKRVSDLVDATLRAELER